MDLAEREEVSSETKNRIWIISHDNRDDIFVLSCHDLVWRTWRPSHDSGVFDSKATNPEEWRYDCNILTRSRGRGCGAGILTQTLSLGVFWPRDLRADIKARWPLDYRTFLCNAMRWKSFWDIAVHTCGPKSIDAKHLDSKNKKCPPEVFSGYVPEEAPYQYSFKVSTKYAYAVPSGLGLHRS